MNSFEAPFTVDSDIDLGTRARHYLAAGDADVTIRRGDVPASLEGEGPDGAAYQIRAERVLVKVPDGPRLLVEAGSRITYCGAEGHTDRDIILFLLGSAWGALCYQRGLIAIHASAVIVDGAVHAFTGQSGAGKSTLAAALASRGRAFFTDDVLLIDPERLDDEPICFAGHKDLKLWRDSSSLVDAEFGAAVRSVAGFEKYYAQPQHQSEANAGRLADLILLADEKRDVPPRIEPVEGGIAATRLAASLYRPAFADAILGRRRLFEGLAKLVGRVSVHRFVRRVHKPDFAAGVEFLDRWIDGER